MSEQVQQTEGLKRLMELSISRTFKKQTLSEERTRKQLDNIRQLIGFYRVYPDLFIESLLKEYNPHNFHFYNYQRLYLRAVMRHRYLYATFPRGYSKSFLSVMVLMIRCILYPNSHLFVTTGGNK